MRMTKQAEQIVNVLAEVVPDEGTTLKQRHGHAALSAAQKIQGEVAPRLKTKPMYTAAWEEFQQQPEAAAPMLETAIGMLLKADVALAQRLDSLLNKFREATGESTTVNTGGGAYVGGGVKVTNGDFVGRDKRTTTITGDGNVVGDHSSSRVVKQQGADAAALARAFADFYTAVQQQPDLPPRDKADVQAELEEVETELQKGEKANEGFIRRRLRNVQRMAPDIYDVVLTTFGNPIAGLGLVAKKIAEKMKADAA
jgi:hypothetical protein